MMVAPNRYLFLYSIGTFVRNFFNRTFILGDTLKGIGRQIDSFECDPMSLQRIRAALTAVGNEVVLLEEILTYIEESVHEMMLPPPPPDYDPDVHHASAQPSTGRRPMHGSVGAQLFGILDLDGTHATLKLRVADMKKNVKGARHKIATLREQCAVISERQMMQFQESMNTNSKNLEDMFKAAERSGASLEIMQVLLSGTLAFEILDRLTGEWSVLDNDWAKGTWGVVASCPLLWLSINLLLWGAMGWGLWRHMQRSSQRSAGVTQMTCQLALPASMAALRRYLVSKELKEENVESSSSTQVRKVSWSERGGGGARDRRWLGHPPDVVSLIHSAVCE
jgi:hypothetical protein